VNVELPPVRFRYGRKGIGVAFLHDSQIASVVGFRGGTAKAHGSTLHHVDTIVVY
jgi:hypothetical protein